MDEMLPMRVVMTELLLSELTQFEMSYYRESSLMLPSFLGLDWKRTVLPPPPPLLLFATDTSAPAPQPAPMPTGVDSLKTHS